MKKVKVELLFPDDFTPPEYFVEPCRRNNWENFCGCCPLYCFYDDYGYAECRYYHDQYEHVDGKIPCPIKKYFDNQEQVDTFSNQKKQLVEHCRTFGYTPVDGKLVADADEDAIIESTYRKFNEYTTNPPKELVDDVLAIAKEKGEVISYDDAAKRVSYTDIFAYIARELNVEFGEKLNMFKVRRWGVDTSSEPVLSKELWDKVQEKLNAE